MRKEKFFVDYGNGRGDWTDKDVLVRDDGFNQRIGGGREMQSTFRYTDGELSFGFEGSRYDERLSPLGNSAYVLRGYASAMRQEETSRKPR